MNHRSSGVGAELGFDQQQIELLIQPLNTCMAQGTFALCPAAGSGVQLLCGVKAC
jgi:hypothetical protein